MIIKDLIDKCSVDSVTRIIASLAKVDESGFQSLHERCTLLINELKNEKDYWVCDDENFCFVGFKNNIEEFPDVLLTDAVKLEDSNFDIKNASNYDWDWNSFLGLSVYQKSFEEYGADVILGRTLYHLTYHDYLEADVASIRKSLELNENLKSVDLCKKLFKKIYVVKYIKNKILNLFQSEEMRTYIDENFDNLSSYKINNIICGSRISLEDKIKILNKLIFSNESKGTDEIYKNSYEAIKYALSHLELEENEIFILKGQGIDEDNLNDREITPETYEYAPFNSYEKAIENIKKSGNLLLEYNSFDEMCVWYVLEKWALSDCGIYEKVIDYYISLKGDIWFYRFDYEYRMKYKKNPDKSILLEKFDVCSDSEDLNIPVPFKVGDILTIDCRPFAELRKVLVIETGDNNDCCSLQCLYIDNQGEIHIGAIKHNSVFCDYEYKPMISSLYKAEIVKDELSEKDKSLQIISEYLNCDEEKGKQLWEFINANDSFSTYGATLKFDKLKSELLDKEV